MKWWHTLGIVLCLMSGGCATLTTGELAVPINAAGGEGTATLVVRSREIEHASSAHLPVLEVSFENHTAEWQNITASRILVANPEESGPVQIPGTQTLKDWRVAVHQRNKVDQANRDTAVELVTAGGWIVADAGSESKNKNVRVGTALVGLLAASAALAIHYSDRKNEAEALPLLESNHLLAGPISMAPYTTTKRWILLYTPDQADADALRLVLSYDLAKRGTERVLLRLKPASRSPRDSHGF